jgi:hypothetical protein
MYKAEVFWAGTCCCFVENFVFVTGFISSEGITIDVLCHRSAYLVVQTESNVQTYASEVTIILTVPQDRG